MHLGSLTISHFWSCENMTVSLRPDLTVLVGENNGGKSNAAPFSYHLRLMRHEIRR